MTGIRRLAVATATAICCLALAAPAATAVVYPNSIAATGDSITRAFNTCPFPFTDCPQNSWATGTEAAVNSFYLRIRAVNEGITGHANNDARSGARMSNLPEQVTRAIEQRVEFVVIEMGANDVCTSSEETMTSVASFEREFERAIRELRERLPAARVAVGSIPSIYTLWEILHTNRSATETWRRLSICQSMLRNATSLSREDEERRLRVQRREVEFNSALERVCATYANCQWDRNTGYNYRFESREVGTNDFFHPSQRGQHSIAEIEFPLIRF
ncbi:MAG TPA: SGNH/GDSL hydrolase family protein [Conexibacter sp.]|nr:SGNH/GDSL hydrolase family protein [Conexibacter sp.]